MIQTRTLVFEFFFFFGSCFYTDSCSTFTSFVQMRGSCAQGQSPAGRRGQSLTAKPTDTGGWPESISKRNGGGLVGYQ